MVSVGTERCLCPLPAVPRALNVILVLQCERRRFLRVGLAVPLLGTVAQLREMVAREGHIPPEQVMGGMGVTGKGQDPLRATEVPSAALQVILAEVSPQGFLRSLGDSEELGAAGEGAPLYAFQPPPARHPGTTTPSPLAGSQGLHSLDWLGEARGGGSDAGVCGTWWLPLWLVGERVCCDWLESGVPCCDW